jgi:hypothetical protein
MHYLMPKAGVLSLHSSANEGPDGDVSLFFGLSGKKRNLILCVGILICFKKELVKPP